uniref:Cytochrome C oxidase n=1 Tax=Saccharum hybrid cultivar SP80-3280 TaxID=193079 RepID=A0A2R4QND5_9POAL|nr:cytochrome C oxidase subunit-like protein [Saccharum hybrid cultivar SP80-3280]AVY91725.1 cytochrome C oxidase [Saccharum hybrid cultivar SP80-3280]
MWRRLHTLAPALRRATAAAAAGAPAAPASSAARAAPLSSAAAAFRRTSPLLSEDKPAKVEDVMPIATGLEREELEAELQGKKRFDMDPPVGPFGTKEAPAVIESYYNKRIVGCPGGEGEDEHDVVWFWLKKDEPHECPVCSQYFVLKVIGDGGDPDGHDDEDDGHH